MAVEIKNHSDGTLAAVTPGHQLLVQSEVHELQHHISRHEANTYQAISIDTGITAQDQTVFHIINNSATHNCVISFIRFVDITSITTKVIGNYFELGFGRTAASGTTTTPVNMNVASGKVADVTVTGIDPTMSGSFTAIDRFYTVLGDDVVLNKHGSIILGLNNTFEIRFISTGTGEARVRITFMMIAK